MSLVIVVSGDRYLTDCPAVERLFDTLPPDTVVVHGGARGLDTLAGKAARRRGFRVEVEAVSDAEWRQLGRAAGPLRNRRMLDKWHPDRVYAFHDDMANSKGTADIVRQATDRGIPVQVSGSK